MQTVKIENCTEYKDKYFKVIVNGEIHAIHHRFLTIQVADGKPLTIKAKYFWNCSSMYQFEPKENISLQVLMNKRLRKLNWFAGPIGALIGVILGRLFEGRPIYALGCVLFLAAIYAVSTRSIYMIREISS